jgi:radical SAM superfamily enzyme YgiQ (UPF0313 family)
VKYKRVLLISPGFNRGRFRLSAHPLAGLGYISEALGNNGIAVDVFDLNLKYTFRDLTRKINEFSPDAIGFTVMTFAHGDLYLLIKKIKALYPHIDMITGGPHISTLRGKALEDCHEIDYGVILEGDRSIVELCRGEDPDNIDGLIHRRDGRILMNDYKKFITDLDSVPFPKYDAFELEKYPTRQIGIVTSRGCPYSCIYCPVIAAIGKEFRQRSAMSVVDEIDHFFRKGYREILILDDNFTLSRRRMEEFCELMGKKDFRGISLKCPNGIRADRVDREILRAMRSIGFDMIAFGVESASDKVLKNIKKEEDIATIEKSVKDACELGFDVDLFFIIGSPGETTEDVEKSFELALRYPVRNANFYNIIPFPSTELFEWLKEKGFLLHSPDKIMNNASHFINNPSFFTPEMSVSDRKRAFKKGQQVTRTIRRKYIENKIKGPLFLRRLFSLLYTFPAVGHFMINSTFLMRVKEKIKGLMLAGRDNVVPGKEI